MDLRNSFLRICDAESYEENFKNFGIDAFTLKILTDEDLQIVGIEDESLRELILQRATNLQIPSEKHVEVNTDKQYIQMVLFQMSLQLKKHLAVLSIAVQRDDVVICDVRLGNASDCIKSSLSLLTKSIKNFEKQISRKKRSRKRHYLVIPGTITLLLLGAFATCKFYKHFTLGS